MLPFYTVFQVEKGAHQRSKSGGFSAEDFFKSLGSKVASNRYRPFRRPRADFRVLRDGLQTGCVSHSPCNLSRSRSYTVCKTKGPNPWCAKQKSRNRRAVHLPGTLWVPAGSSAGGNPRREARGRGECRLPYPHRHPVSDRLRAGSGACGEEMVEYGTADDK